MLLDRPKTVEYFRKIYMDDGFEAMTGELKELIRLSNAMSSSGIVKTRFSRTEILNIWIKIVLYGYNPNGTPRSEPVKPDPYDMIVCPSKYDFEDRVYSIWIGNKINNGS